MKDSFKWLIIIILILAIGGAVFALSFKGRKEERFQPEKELPKVMEISSSAFKNNSGIPSKYTCDGSGVNPPLNIGKIPSEAQSLVLIVDDPDAPGGTFLHWLVWNIDPKVSLIEEDSLPLGGVQGENDFGKKNYGPPCPPSEQHRYFFKVYALDKKLDLTPGLSKKEVEKAMKDHILDQAQLVGLYQRE